MEAGIHTRTLFTLHSTAAETTSDLFGSECWREKLDVTVGKETSPLPTPCLVRKYATQFIVPKKAPTPVIFRTFGLRRGCQDLTMQTHHPNSLYATDLTSTGSTRRRPILRILIGLNGISERLQHPDDVVVMGRIAVARWLGVSNFVTAATPVYFSLDRVSNETKTCQPSAFLHERPAY